MLGQVQYLDFTRHQDFTNCISDMVHGFHLFSFSGLQQIYDSLDAIKSFIAQDTYYSSNSAPLVRRTYQTCNEQSGGDATELKENEPSESVFLDDENRLVDNYRPDAESEQRDTES